MSVNERKNILDMETIPSSSLRLSNIEASSNSLFLPRIQRNKATIVHIICILALFLNSQYVSCSSNEGSYSNENPTYQDAVPGLDQGRSNERDDDSKHILLKNYKHALDYHNSGQLYEMKFKNEEKTMGPISTDLPPFNPGGLPMISDGAFSLVTMIYVSIAFLFVFFAFCWKNNYPKDSPKGGSRGKAKKTCTIVESDEKPGGAKPEQIDMKQIISTYDYESNEKLER